LGALTSGQAYAQEQNNPIQIQSLSWGIAPGQIARISVVNFPFADGSVRSVTARIQLLDMEGDVIAQSDAIRVEPGKIRYWDAPYEQIGGGREPGTGRLQLRARILFEERSFDRDRPLYNPFITVDVVDSRTGRALVIWLKFMARQEFPGD
jgi:hypothetical protein